MQDPRLLSGYLDPLWDLRVNQGAYYESWPWRGADPEWQQRLVTATLARPGHREPIPRLQSSLRSRRLGVSHAGRDGRGDCCRRSRWREMDGVGNSHAAAQLTARPAGSAP
jgi:hypothetical protein